jgi:WhiB family redox-sensing transcriptional regulator
MHNYAKKGCRCEPCRKAAADVKSLHSSSKRRLPSPNTDPNEWMQDAACKKMEPSLFYPSDELTPRQIRDGISTAKMICQSCPVVMECLETAIETFERGVWGGTSESERELIRRDREKRKHDPSIHQERRKEMVKQADTPMQQALAKLVVLVADTADQHDV